jgi:hypothetical protein
MKYIFTAFLASFFSLSIKAQPGKYAGTHKALIGKVYTDSRNIPQLKSWTFQEGAVLNPLTDPEMILVDVFKKGTTYLVFFSVREDTASENSEIVDVIEVKGVAKGWTVRTSMCRQNKQASSYLFVWGKEDTKEYMKVIKKVWRFNPDKRKIEIIPVKGVDCENIGC